MKVNEFISLCVCHLPITFSLLTSLIWPRFQATRKKTHIYSKFCHFFVFGQRQKFSLDSVDISKHIFY